jgi:hydrogenase maturation protein HypF
MAYAWLAEAFGEPQPLPRALAGRVDDLAWRAMAQVYGSRELSPLTSSIGRLLDAVGALCGICPRISYEGQAAVELEAAAARARSLAEYEIELTAELALDPRSAIRGAVDDLLSGRRVPEVAAGVHAALAEVTVRACRAAAARSGVDDVVLSGGVFQNRLLLESVAADLRRSGLRVLTPTRLPPNDGGISFGQAAIAAARDHARGVR